MNGERQFQVLSEWWKAAPNGDGKFHLSEWWKADSTTVSGGGGGQIQMGREVSKTESTVNWKGQFHNWVGGDEQFQQVV